MQTFKDKEGHEWPVEITVASITRIRSESGGRFDLFNPNKDNLGAGLADDLPLFWEVLWFVCSPSARDRKITADQFGELMADDVLLVAQQKFFAEWRDFFRRCGREPQATMVETALKGIHKALEIATAKLTPETRAKMDAALEAKLNQEQSNSLGKLEAYLGVSLAPSNSSNSAGPSTSNSETPDGLS